MQMLQQVRNSIVTCWLGLSLFSLLSGCGKPITQSDLIGTYVADYPSAKEKLTLLAGGKFIHQVTLKSNSQVLETNGTWTFNATGRRISFEDGYFGVLDGFGQPRKKIESSNASLPIVDSLGKVQIGDGPPVEYKKQSGP
jgi:hypothetical protein